MSGFNRPSLIQALQDGPVVRVVIAKHAGSAPRETGTAMLIGSNSQSGTIGGGALELAASRSARDMLASATDTRVLKMPLGPALGQCCGGSVTLVLERFAAQTTLPAEAEIFARPIQGAASVPLQVQRTITQMRNGTEQRRLVFTEGWLVEAAQETSRPLWLYGAGHVGRAIVDVLAGLPFHITWVDTAANRFPATLPDHVTPLVAQNPASVVPLAPATAQHLVLTYSHAYDLEICHAVLSRDFASLGVIGSDTKRSRFCRKLRTLGHCDAQIFRMICPIGNRALGKTPKAIAVGIAADLLSPAIPHSTRKEATL